MKHSFLKQLWVAFKIWVIALAVNTLAGSFYLSGGIEKKLVLVGLLWGSIFSLPILVILLIIIHHCVSRRKDGLQLFQYVFVAGLALTVASAIFFFILLPVAPPGHMFISVMAAVTGIGVQYNALFKLARYDNEYENFPS